MLGKSSPFLGLDIGASGTKAVVLSGKRTACKLIGCDVMDTRGEGILNDSELYASIQQWLATRKWNNLITAIALPQFLATTMTRDFPVSNTRSLNDMVTYETRQVAGLSDEALVHDFQPLPPGLDRHNPVIIGISREQVARDRLNLFNSAHIRTDCLGLGGTAVINAFLNLFPDAAKNSDPVLILDLGHENSTAIVLAAGQPLFMGSLMFSGEKFDAACSGDGTGSQRKVDVTEVDLMEESGRSPVLTAARLLESEIHAALETWRAQEEGPLAKAVISNVFICGGVCRMKGLDKWLEERLEAKVAIFGPSDGNNTRPELTLAYGLALQAAGAAAIPLSLLPEDVKLLQLRQRSWPLLAIALAIVTATAIGLEAAWFMHTGTVSAVLAAEDANLDECGQLITRIQAARETLDAHESRMLPIVEAGNQAAHLAEAIIALGNACGPKDWFVYLADENSYQLTRTQNKPKLPDPQQGMFANCTKADLGDSGGQPEFPLRIAAADITLTPGYIAAGYTPHLPSQPYEPVRAIAAKLEANNAFKNVDILPEAERVGREDIFRPWVAFLRKIPHQYKAFSFKLPFASPDIVKPPKPPPKKGRK